MLLLLSLIRLAVAPDSMSCTPAGELGLAVYAESQQTLWIMTLLTLDSGLQSAAACWL